MSDQGDARTVHDLVFVGLNRRVHALDRYSGELVWSWKAPRTTSIPTILLDGDRLIVGINGYIYCLDPLFGQLVWENPLKGMGVGVASLASVAGQSSGTAGHAAAAAAQAAAAAAASA